VNQFFGGVGGEEAANVGVSLVQGAVGAGRALQQALGEHGTVLATLLCGDNAANERRDATMAAIETHLRALRPDVVLAGPAFGSGRYGLACVEVCKVARALDLPAVTGMHPENPGAQQPPADVVIVPTGQTSADMALAVAAMTRLALKLGRGEALGPAESEGYLPRGVRRVHDRQRPGYQRALDMLLAKLYGTPFVTEVPIHLPERVAPAAPLTDLSSATIAMVTTGGLVRKGNPDKQVSSNATRYYRHSVAELRGLSGKDWEAYHSGYFNHIVNSNPNYILPLNFLRDLEAEGTIGRVFEWIYALPGVSTPVATARALGRSIAQDLRDGQVDGCLLVAT
jgi:glycine reductase